MMTTNTDYRRDKPEMPNVFIVEQTDIPIDTNLRHAIQERLRRAIENPRHENFARSIKEDLDDAGLIDSYWHVVVGKDFSWQVAVTSFEAVIGCKNLA